MAFDCNIVCQSQNGFADMLAAGSYLLHSSLFASLHQLATATVIKLHRTVLFIHKQQLSPLLGLLCQFRPNQKSPHCMLNEMCLS